VQPYQTISTGSLTLDLATRVGGWVRGRTHEIVGPEGVGKTTLCIHSMIDAQRQGLPVGFIDMEQTWDWDWAEDNGLDTSDDMFFYVQPDDSEDVSDQLRMMCRTKIFGAIYLDSVGGMESKQALSKEAEEVSMGRNAQVITRMVKRIAVDARRNNVAVIFVNQYRANLSGMGSDISAGPKALKYATTMKVSLRRTSEGQLTYTEGGDTIPFGTQIKAKVERNKTAPMGHTGEFWILNKATDEYGPIGIGRADEALVIGVATGIIQQGGGGNYVLPNGDKYRGKEKVLTALYAEPDLVQRIREEALAVRAGEVIPSNELVADGVEQE
jgi:recombination protein RecA